MKKIAIVLGVALISNVNNSFYGSQLIQREYDGEYTQPQFLDASSPTDEYTFVEIAGNQETQIAVDDQTDIAEYDQHICDEVKPPKISTAEALIKEMLGYVLIQYITLKEVTHAYYQGMREALQKWFATFMKA